MTHPHAKSSRAAAAAATVVLAIAISLAGLAVLGSFDASTAQAATSNMDYSLRLGYTRYLADNVLNARLDRAKNAGATAVLVPVGWDQLEPSQDDGYSWAYLDKTINAIEARGLKTNLQIQGSPAWVRPNCASVWCPPRGTTQLGFWRDLMKDVTARYGTRVAHYEQWNEPNHKTFWPSGPNPTEWAALLRAGYLGAKAGNPNVTVVSGGLSANDVGFQQRTYTALKRYSDAAANKFFFDELGVHPYAICGGVAIPPQNSPSHCTGWSTSFGNKDLTFQGYKKLKTLMNQQGDSAKKLYLAEFGYPHQDLSWVKGVPDVTRAQYLKTAYALTRDSGYVSTLSWFTYQDQVSWQIVANDGTESLTFKAFREITP